MKRASVVVYCCLFLFTLAAASTVQAGGFALYEWSNRGIAMGTTGYAQGVDASVVATNPSLMTELEGKHALAGFALITPHTTVVVDGHKNKTQNDTFKVPHAYYVQQMESNPNVWFGVGMFTRFGLGTHYEDNWNGRGGLQFVDLESVSLTPSVAFKFNEKFSMAVGVEILKGGIHLKRSTVFGPISARTSGYAIGGNISFNYKFDDQWSTGFTYRAPMTMDTTGSGQFPGQPSSENEQSIKATLPGSYSLGVAYKPADNWVWEFDVIHTRWDSVDKMTYSGTIDSEHWLHYKNTWRGQIGTEYWATDWMAVRFGYVYDQTPTRGGDASFMLPANDRQLVSTGLGFKWDKWTLDASFMYVQAKERSNLSISNPATAPGAVSRVDFKDGKTWITGMSLGYAF